tara:strand:+ start:10203 stop:10673 length:471 start_codon:yes stop_codon:yes gene_type:complete
MYIVIQPDDFNISNVFLSEKAKNNILNGGDFYRILYSTNCATLNGIFISLKFKIFDYEEYFNKIKCYLSPGENKRTINFIQKFEKELLINTPDMGNSTPEYKIMDQLKMNFIKIINDGNNLNMSNSTKEINIILKVSGIWTNGDNYGLTFRFFIHP